MSSSPQGYFDIRSVLAYWHAEYGDEALVGGDLAFERGSLAYSRDARGAFRRSFVDTLRSAWRPLFGTFVQTAMVEPGRVSYCSPNDASVSPRIFNWVRLGDLAATLTSVDRTDALRRAGLLSIATPGLAYRLNNTAGVAEARAVNGVVVPGGLTGSPFVATAFVRGSGMFSLGPDLMASGTAYTATPEFRRYEYRVDAIAASARFAIRAAPGADIEFVLAMLEPGLYPTTPYPAQSLSNAVVRDGDTLLYRDAPDPTDGLLLYVAAVLGADARDLEGATLMHVGTDADPQATIFFGLNGDLVLAVRPGDGYEYRAVVPLYAATREQFVEVAAWWGSDGALYAAASIAGEASRLAYVAEDSDGCLRFVGRYEDATAWLVEDSDGALRFSAYEPDPIIPLYLAGDDLAAGDVMPAPPTGWSADQTWLGQSPLETDRGAFLFYAWKHLRGDHVNPAHLVGGGDAGAVVRQARDLALGLGATPLGTGRSY